MAPTALADRSYSPLDLGRDFLSPKDLLDHALSPEHAVFPLMKKAGYGRIINLSSTLGAVAVAGRSPYASSKGAVRLMTQTLALEGAPHGITVNSLCPGPFLTPMNEAIRNASETKKAIIGAVPLGRWAEMDEIQGAAIFLASEASSYVTGSSLFVDGGWTAH
jgi:NAD(P)-dependent dehydrogenase (short-subunit alcohol dehydrogenase family)